jgi:Sec-independent protein translocase protein TatA
VAASAEHLPPRNTTGDLSRSCCVNGSKRELACRRPQFLHTHVGGPLDDRRRREQEKERARLHLSSLAPSVAPISRGQVAHYHSTPPVEKGVAIVLGLGALSALSYAGASAVKAYKEYQSTLPSPEEQEAMRKQQEEEEAARREKEQTEAQANAKNEQKTGEKRENVFAKWFGVGVGAKYYEGGFEETMTRREAALILGVRESSPASRIKEAHRKLLVLNHPDTGGSTYVAGKINEAKELLLKGKRGK